MKKGKIIVVFLLISLTLFFTACNEDSNNENNNGIDEVSNTESDNSTGEVESEDTSSEFEEDIQTIYSDNIITWGTTNYQPSDAALSEFNKRLIDMGYDFSLQIVSLDFSDYQNQLKEYEKENGPLDILHLPDLR